MQDTCIWFWMLHIAHGICSYLIITLLISSWHNFWLDLSTDTSLLEVLRVSLFLAQMLRIFIRLVLHYLLSSIFILHSSLIAWWDLCCWYMSRGPLFYLKTYSRYSALHLLYVFVFASSVVDWWVTQFRYWDHYFDLSACSL